MQRHRQSTSRSDTPTNTDGTTGRPDLTRVHVHHCTWRGPTTNPQTKAKGKAGFLALAVCSIFIYTYFCLSDPSTFIHHLCGHRSLAAARTHPHAHPPSHPRASCALTRPAPCLPALSTLLCLPAALTSIVRGARRWRRAGRTNRTTGYNRYRAHGQEREHTTGFAPRDEPTNSTSVVQ